MTNDEALALTPEAARAMIDNCARVAPARLVAVANEVAHAALVQAADARADLVKARKAFKRMKEDFDALVAVLNSANPGADVPVARAPAAPRPASVPPQGEVRLGGDGQPLTPEEIERERMMDEATAGMGPHPGAGGSSESTIPDPRFGNDGVAAATKPQRRAK